MERKPRQKKEMLLPSSLLEDIEYDELDKEMQSKHIQENNAPTKEGISILINLIFHKIIYQCLILIIILQHQMN